MLNVCATLTFPAIPDITFDLVIATKSYNSALLQAAELGEDVDLNAIANEVYSKNGRNIMATFKATVRSFGIVTHGEFYIVADRAPVNVAGFGQHFISCWPHQLDLAFKWALNEMKTIQPTNDLTVSLETIRTLTTHCKTHNIVFQIPALNELVSYTTSPSNPSKTRWFGILKQVTLYLKAKTDVMDKASRDRNMQVITDKIN